MALLESAFLRVLHSFYFLIALFSACWHRIHITPPLPLEATRRRTPQHLALLLVPDSAHDLAVVRESLLESVRLTVDWCRAVGVQKLTLYDSEGLLVDCVDQISERVDCELAGYESSSDSDVEYPLTPPSSDCSDSRPLSPEDSFQKESSIVTVRVPQIIRKRPSKYGLKKR
ncbi:hyphal tip protein, partial [Mycena rosella]